jgi:translation initiation factor 2B subunit (eIF-2B alpha/beta/delta family)
MPDDVSGVERAVALLRSAATRLRADHEHGASWLAREAAAALGEAAALALAGLPASERARASDVRALRQAARDLAHARPSMAAIATTVARIGAAGWPLDAPALDAATALERMRAEANQLAAAWNDAAAAIGAHAQDLLTGTVLTHSRSGTVEQVLARLASARRVNALIVTTSLPGGEGSALAHALARRGIDVTLVADAAMGWALAGVDAIVLGADSVRADASLVNKVGSLPLALCAQRAGVPVYVLCERLKIAPSGWPLTLEEMDPAELLPTGEPHLRARNPYFDHTPADLITAIITEAGPTSREHIAQLAETAARELAALEQA